MRDGTVPEPAQDLADHPPRRPQHDRVHQAGGKRDIGGAPIGCSIGQAPILRTYFALCLQGIWHAFSIGSEGVLKILDNTSFIPGAEYRKEIRVSACRRRGQLRCIVYVLWKSTGTLFLRVGVRIQHIIILLQYSTRSITNVTSKKPFKN